MAHALGKVKLDLSQTSYSGAGFHAKQQKPLKEQTCDDVPVMVDTKEESIFGDKQSSKSSKNFKVVVRVRPLIKRELSMSNALCLKIESKHAIQIFPEVKRDQEQSASVHAFGFDRVYDKNSTQESLYTTAVKPIVHSLLKGYNGSIIAYGQTGTGKTYTIEGLETENRGVIPRVAEEIFNYIEKSTDAKSKFLVRASFLQIYNEKIMDLFQLDYRREFPNDKVEYLKIRESSTGGVYVENLSEHIVKTPGDLQNLLQKGSQNRATAATKMNRESSRSHAVFSIIVEHSELNFQTQQKHVTIGKLNLVDLAGSERLKESGAHGMRMEETIKINVSLTAFGKVILALTTPGTPHIPYRDSKLTRLLQDSLGGNCKTVLITTITPAVGSYGESLRSLTFANKAKSVKNFAVINEDVGEQALLSTYEKEIKRLRSLLQEQQGGKVSAKNSMQILGMESHLQEAIREKAEVMTELEKRSLEIAQANADKEQLEDKIKNLEEQLLTGGTKSENSIEFKEAVKKLQTEYDEKFQQLEMERLALAKEKEYLKKQQEDIQKGLSNLDLSDNSGKGSADSATRNRINSAASMSSINQEEVQTVIMQTNDIDDYISALLDSETGIPLLDSQQRTFTGAAAAKWFQENLHGVTTLTKADNVGKRFMELNVIAHVKGNPVFSHSEKEIYYIRKPPPTSVPMGMPPYGRSVEGSMLSRSGVGSMSVVDGNYGRASSSLSLHAEPTVFGENDYASTPLHQAARKGERSVVKSLIPQFDVNCVDSQGRTPLMYAVIADKAKCCETLLRLGAQPNALDVNGRTALLWAAYHGHADSMRSLLKSPETSPDVSDPDGRTALHWSTKPESIECLRVIAKFCGNIVNKPDNSRTTPLHWAVLCRHPIHVSILLRLCGADPLSVDGEGRSSLHYAVTKQSVECCQVILEQCAELVNLQDKKKRSPLHLAISGKGSLEIVMNLLSVPNVDVNVIDIQKTTPVHWAVINNRPDILRLLIQQGAKTTTADAKKMQPIHYALQREYAECAKLLQIASSSQSNIPYMALRSESFSVAPPPATHRSHSAKISADSFDILTGNTDTSGSRVRKASLPFS